MVKCVAVLGVALLSFAGCRAAPPAAPSAAAVRTQREAGAAARAAVWTTPPGETASPLSGSPLPGERVVVRDAVPSRWTFEGDIAVLSSYVWRGALALDDPVLQPSATVGYGGWSFNVWANVDLGDANGTAGELTEVDLTLQYAHEIRGGRVPATLFGGGVWYTSPTGWFQDLAELYGGVGFDVFLQPTLTVFLGIENVEGLYLSLDLEHEVALPLGTLALRGGVGAGDDHFLGALFGAPVNAVGELYVEAALALPVACWSLSPSVRFSTLLDGDLRDASAKNDHVIFGLTASISR